MTQEGRKLPDDTVTHRDLHLRRLVGTVDGKTRVGAMTTANVRDWLAGLEMSRHSEKHRRANVHRPFDWLVQERIAKRKIVSKIKIQDDFSGDVNVLTLAQAKRVFEASAGHRSIGRLALEAFAGLRFTSAAWH